MCEAEVVHAMVMAVLMLVMMWMTVVADRHRSKE
jgi:hypothetical protein